MQRFKNILLVLGDSHLTALSVQRAVELVRVNDARLTVVDVIPSNPLGRSLQAFSDKMEKLQVQMMVERKKEMEEMLYGYLEDLTPAIEVLSGKPFVEIIKFVQYNDFDLVIKSAEKEKIFSSRIFGSTDFRLLRKCPCPVWIVKEDDHASSHKILAAVELEEIDENQEELNKQIVEIAASLAVHESAELHLVNAYVIIEGDRLAKKISKSFEIDASQWVDEQKKSVQSAQDSFVRMFDEYLKTHNYSDVTYRYHFLEGEAEEVIAGLVKKEAMDLVVMGTVGRSDIAGFLVGNTSEAVLQQINCSVLAVKPPGFISPVTIQDR